MLSKQDKCIQLGKDVATHMFALLINPEYRGKDFKWKNFPIQAANKAAMQMPVSFAGKVRAPDILAARTAAYEQAHKLIRTSNIADLRIVK